MSVLPVTTPIGDIGVEVSRNDEGILVAEWGGVGEADHWAGLNPPAAEAQVLVQGYAVRSGNTWTDRLPQGRGVETQTPQPQAVVEEISSAVLAALDARLGEGSAGVSSADVLAKRRQAQQLRRRRAALKTQVERIDATLRRMDA